MGDYAPEGTQWTQQTWTALVARRFSSWESTKAQTCQEELTSARETVTVLQSQLHTAKLEAKVNKLWAMEQVRQQSDKERHLLQMDREKECGRLTELSDQL